MCRGGLDGGGGGAHAEILWRVDLGGSFGCPSGLVVVTCGRWDGGLPREVGCRDLSRELALDGEDLKRVSFRAKDVAIVRVYACAVL